MSGHVRPQRPVTFNRNQRSRSSGKRNLNSCRATIRPITREKPQSPGQIQANLDSSVAAYYICPAVPKIGPTAIGLQSGSSDLRTWSEASRLHASACAATQLGRSKMIGKPRAGRRHRTRGARISRWCSSARSREGVGCLRAPDLCRARLIPHRRRLSDCGSGFVHKASRKAFAVADRRPYMGRTAQRTSLQSSARAAGIRRESPLRHEA